MCGIVGFYKRSGNVTEDERKLVREMTALLSYRGPDGEGSVEDSHVVFGHRRLAIVELSNHGRQPMQTEDGRVTVTYNGEIYNHADLRARFLNGTSWRGHSDTETILRLFAARGADSFASLAGIFAFAIWDSAEKALYLVRDPLGVKQVYYWSDKGRVVFASEIKAVLLHPDVVREADHGAIAEYLHFHSNVGDRTFFRGVRVVPPGCYLRVDANSERVVRYAPALDLQPLDSDSQSTAEELQKRISDVVRSQLMSDVPVGCFLSGGIDSSVVAKYARDYAEQREVPAFGCYFNAPGALNEEPYALEVSKSLGLNLRSVHPTAEDFTSLFARALWHQDEPKIGPAMISMWKVSELAAAEVKVCLGGQAADEIFAGYARYATAAPLRTIGLEIGKRLRRSRGAVGSNVQKQLRKGDTASRLLRIANPLQTWEQRYFNTIAQLDEATLKAVIPNAPEITNRAAQFEKFKSVVRQAPSADAMDRAMFWDRSVYLPGLFQQDDRMSMAHSLETRVPLADPRLVAFAVRIPNRWKMNGLTNKWILKVALKGVIPDWVIDRQKAGFDTPTRLWFQNEARELVFDLLAGSRTRERGLFDTSRTATLLERPMTATDEVLIWKLINIEQWFRIFIDRSAEALRTAP